MFDFGIELVELVARTAIVYAVFILVLRVFGKRELGQFTIFDLALLLLAANALQPAAARPGAGRGHPAGSTGTGWVGQRGIEGDGR